MANSITITSSLIDSKLTGWCTQGQSMNLSALSNIKVAIDKMVQAVAILHKISKMEPKMKLVLIKATASKDTKQLKISYLNRGTHQV